MYMYIYIFKYLLVYPDTSNTIIIAGIWPRSLFVTPARVEGRLYSIGRSPDSVDHEPPHEDTKILLLLIQSRGEWIFPV
jgi:hypothetical protein